MDRNKTTAETSMFLSLSQSFVFYLFLLRESQTRRRQHSSEIVLLMLRFLLKCHDMFSLTSNYVNSFLFIVLIFIRLEEVWNKAVFYLSCHELSLFLFSFFLE